MSLCSVTAVSGIKREMSLCSVTAVSGIKR